MITIMLSLIGCGGRITPEGFRALEKTCEGNGGLKYMHVDAIGNAADNAICKNGIIITRRALKTKDK